MIKLNSKVTDNINFYQGNNPIEILDKYGSPLYLYNEKILRKNCREMKSLVTYPHFQVNYSAKANSNLALLQIVCEEGLCVDAMSPGEIFVEQQAGFESDKIFYIGNNVSEDEMRYAIERNILVSVDSVSQLEQFGRINAGGMVAVRFNPGVGAGHHEKVVTGGNNTKFGVNAEYLDDVKNIISKHSLKLVGINQHIGSLFMDSDSYVLGTQNLLSIAKNFDSLEFIDLGGGFGIPYNKQTDESRLDLQELGKRLDELMKSFSASYGSKITFKIEPGRYIPAEAAALLGCVHATKYNGKTKYIGTDIGFNVLARPVMYDSYHEIEVYRHENKASEKLEKVTIVGNICETGDILAKDRELPQIFEGDALALLDAGAYGSVMSSNYNNRLRPAEVLIRENSSVVLIRERDELADLTKRMKKLY